MTDTPGLLQYLCETAQLGLVELTDAIDRECRTGNGVWLTPEAATGSGRPATHMHEIALFGVTAHGASPEDAVANWRRVARRVAGLGAAPRPPAESAARELARAVADLRAATGTGEAAALCHIGEALVARLAETQGVNAGAIWAAAARAALQRRVTEDAA